MQWELKHNQLTVLLFSQQTCLHKQNIFLRDPRPSLPSIPRHVSLDEVHLQHSLVPLIPRGKIRRTIKFLVHYIWSSPLSTEIIANIFVIRLYTGREVVRFRCPPARRPGGPSGSHSLLLSHFYLSALAVSRSHQTTSTFTTNNLKIRKSSS